MDDHRKSAYRYLLYWALLDIRPLAWLRFDIFWFFNPFRWRTEFRRVRRAGAIAAWLHNLALFSSLDFDSFDEDWFWRDLSNLSERHPGYQLMNYKNVFDRRLAELSQSDSTD